MRVRWRAVGALTAVSCLTVASCDGDVGDENQEPQQVEVFSWGSSEPQRLAFDDLSVEFEEGHPDLQVVNPAEEMQSQDQARRVLEARLSQGDPPGAFQSRAGAGLSDYVEDGYVAPLDDVYDATSLADALPEQLIEQLAYRGTAIGDDQEPGGEDETGDDGEPVPDAEDGPFYTVPVSIRRSNLLWYNPDVLEEAGVRGAVTTLGDFLDALDAVEEETGAAPLALGPGWTVDHLLENMLLASMGAEEYNELWGPTADWTSAEVEEALDVFSEVLDYTEQIDEDRGWQGAAEAVADGSAAFYVMGDWAVAHYEEMGLVPREDYGWVPTPGTEGVYLWMADGFSRPTGAEDDSDADAWLEFVASREGQDVINPVLGAIPARTDADLEAYTESEYLSWALAQWQEAELAGSFWHGASASVTWREGVDSALRAYLRDEDIAAFQDELEAHAQDASAQLVVPAED